MIGSADLRQGPVTVRSPASSANLGPGYDCMGLALNIEDIYSCRVVDGSGVTVHSEGEGASEVPADETHLVARALRAGLDHAGVGDVGLEVHCRNVIPHGRGLGSSSAAIVGGLALARELLAHRQGILSDEVVVRLSTRLEGHPDNVAAAALGGLTVSWTDDFGGRAVRLDMDPSIRVLVFVPSQRSLTSETRGLIPDVVPHADAASNAARSALLVHALTLRPDLLLPATRDLLHQQYRRSAYPRSWELIQRLRAQTVPAALSGAGPSVIAFLGSGSDGAQQLDPNGAALLDQVATAPGFSVLRPEVAHAAGPLPRTV